MTYRVLTNSRRIEKDFLRIITGFSEKEAGCNRGWIKSLDVVGRVMR
jgi:hypothetical protein